MRGISREALAWRGNYLVEVVPGLGVAAAGVALVFAGTAVFPAVSPLIAALLLGTLATNVGLYPRRLAPGFRFATRTPLRAGIVLLGLQLTLPDILELGAPVLTVVIVATAVTFVGTAALGRRIGLTPQRSLLVASGIAVCGASAVAAMNETVRGEDEDVMVAVALVTVLGTLDVLLLPTIAGYSGLSAEAFGVWSGASVHEVGQVVAVAGTAGATALSSAVVVKLTRVVLLAPLLIGTGVWLRHRGSAPTGQRPNPIPLFVVGFLAMMVVSSSGMLPDGVRGPVRTVQDLLLCTGLFGMGASAHLGKLWRASGSALLLGTAGSVLILAVTYLGIRWCW